MADVIEGILRHCKSNLIFVVYFSLFIHSFKYVRCHRTLYVLRHLYSLLECSPLLILTALFTCCLKTSCVFHCVKPFNRNFPGEVVEVITAKSEPQIIVHAVYAIV